MTSPYHLKPLAEYDVVFVNVDDVLLQTTLTHDKLSNAPVTNGVHPDQGRWADKLRVMEKSTGPMIYPLYAGADLLLNMITMRKMPNALLWSTVPDLAMNKANRIFALKKWNDRNPVFFVGSNADKREFLRKFSTKNDVIVDSDLSALSGQSCDTILINPDINENGCSLIDLVNYWRT